MRMSDGTLVATTYQPRDPRSRPTTSALVLARRGQDLGPPFMPHHDGTKTQHGFASLFEMPEGPRPGLARRPRIGAVQGRPGRRSDGAALRLLRREWKQTADDLVNLRVCDCCQTSVAVTADGVITAFRDRTDEEIRDINVTRLEQGKWTDATPVHEDNWEIDACPVNGPAVSARGRDVAPPGSRRNNQGQAFGAFSTDAGRTWGEPSARRRQFARARRRRDARGRHGVGDVGRVRRPRSRSGCGGSSRRGAARRRSTSPEAGGARQRLSAHREAGGRAVAGVGEGAGDGGDTQIKARSRG